MGKQKIPPNTTGNVGNKTSYHPISPEGFLPREELIRITGREVVAMMADYSNGYLLGWHHHGRTQLLYPSTGVVTVRTPEAVWVVTPEKALLLPAGLEHQVKMSGVVEMRSLYLNESALPSQIKDCCLVDISPMLRELLRHVVHLPKEYDEAGADGRFMSVVIDQISLTPSMMIKLPQPKDDKIRWIEKALIENPADNRSLEDWAKDVGASSRTLARKFKEDINISFREWRLRIRLVAAIRELAMGESVSNVAHNVGFSSESAFIDRFKKATGVTPGRYFQ